ncbi:hypothetical protein [Peribacillus sp. NPDC096540]|uniref:hypothetical protein n=1 Tax=Peribacillus sp. NPDC096540 TaxID=3390612 RepID=UPI003D04DD26
MDIVSKQKYMNLLIEWMEREEKTIFISTHQMKDIRKLAADYLIFINRGQMIGEFEKDKLSQQYKRFWLSEDLSSVSFPGGIERKGLRMVTSNLPLEAEAYFQREGIKWHAEEYVELE